MVDSDDGALRSYFEYLKNRTALSFFARSFYFRAPARNLSGRILDVGCGIAEYSRWHRGEYLGLDQNPYVVQYNRKRGLTCFNGSAESIPFESEYFDGVIITHVLEHLDEPAGALRQIWRVLRPGGLLFAAVPMRAGFHRDSTHRFYYDRQILNRSIIETGFTVNRLWSFPFPWSVFGDWFYFNELRVLAVKQLDGE